MSNVTQSLEAIGGPADGKYLDVLEEELAVRYETRFGTFHLYKRGTWKGMPALFWKAAT